jgi:hypothetical protein
MQENRKKQKNFPALPMASRRQIDQIFVDGQTSAKSFSHFFKIKNIPDGQPSAKKF